MLMEAMAKGLIVCSTFHSGIPELIEHAKNGFLVPERDENAISEVLGNILDGKERWETIKKAAYQKIEEQYDIGKLNRQLIHFFRCL